MSEPVIFTLIKRIFCRHRDVSFCMNLYGDQIIHNGWNRSLWECHKCGMLVGKKHLHKEPSHE